MTTYARGRHRRLRRNILHTVIATALLAGTFTAVDQTLNAQSAQAADSVAPKLTERAPEISTNGLTLTITYNETLSSTTASASNFTAVVDGQSVKPSSVTASGTKVVLTFASAISASAVVKISYAAPSGSSSLGNNAIQDSAGNDAARFSLVPVTNRGDAGVINPSVPGQFTFPNTSPSVTATVTATNTFMVSQDKMEAWRSRTTDISSAFSPTSTFRKDASIYAWATHVGRCGIYETAATPGVIYPCLNKEEVKITFSRAVENPVLNINDLSGGHLDGTNSIFSDYRLVEDGSLAQLGAAGNFEVHSDKKSFGVIATPGTGFTGVAGQMAADLLPSGAYPNAYGAGYGSVQVLGTFTTVTFEVTLKYVNFTVAPATTPATPIRSTVGAVAEGIAIIPSLGIQPYTPTEIDQPTDKCINDGTTTLLSNATTGSGTLKAVSGFATNSTATSFGIFDRTTPNNLVANGDFTNEPSNIGSNTFYYIAPGGKTHDLSYYWATLSTGTNLITLTSGDTSTLAVGQAIGKLPDGSPGQLNASTVYVKSIISSTEFTVGDITGSTDLNHAAAGLIVMTPKTSKSNISINTPIPSWRSTGGGSATYAHWTKRTPASSPNSLLDAPNNNQSAGRVYFGNKVMTSITPSPTFDGAGYSTTQYVSNMGTTYGGTTDGSVSSPFAIDQDIQTRVGSKYRLHFSQGTEVMGNAPGIAAFKVSGYDPIYYRVNNANTEYVVEFIATSTSTNIAFISWGHLPTSVNAGLIGAELVLDDVIVNACQTVVTPFAETDSSSGPFNTAQTKDVIANDTTPDTNGFTASTLKFCGSGQTPPACSATSVSVTGGTYTINSSNQIVFTPTNGFSGVAPPVTYQVTDGSTNTVSSTYTPTVNPPPAPTAVNDAQSSAWDVNQSYSPLTNDTVSAGTTKLTSSLKLCPTTATSPFTTTNCNATSVTVTGEGVYTLNTSTGVVEFNPDATFIGVAQTPIKYVFTDSLSQVASATITPTVGPKATSDTVVVSPGATATFDAITGAGGLATGASLNTSQTFLCGASETAPACTKTTVTVSGVGTYTLDQSTGVVTLVAAANATEGTKASLTYVVKDSTGLTASSTLTPIVPGPPVAVNDAQTGAWDTIQNYTPLTNGDVPSAGGTITNSTFKLCPMDATAPFTNTNCNLTSVAVTGQGVYTLSGTTVEFNPESTFTGTATTPVRYVFADSTLQFASATITPTVVPLPVAVNDANQSNWDVNQSYTPLSNDSVDSRTTMVNSSLKLCPTTASTPFTTTNCNATSVTVTGQGVYTLNTTTGVVTFDPDPTFFGEAQTPVRYVFTDALSQVASATITPKVSPKATPDTLISFPGATSTFDPITGVGGLATGANLNTAQTFLCGANEIAPACTQTTVSVTGVGTYTLNQGTGVVTLVVASTATAGTKAALTYVVKDSTGLTASSTLTPTISVPVAVDDAQTDAWDTNQTYTPLTNGDTASSGATITNSSMKLCPTNATAPYTATNCNLTSVTVAGEGVYTLSGTTVVFDPYPTFTGVATTPVRYIFADSSTQIASALIRPTVSTPPVPTSQPDVTSGIKGATQTINLLTNTPGVDTAGISGVTLKADSVKLCGAGETSPNCNQTSVTVAGVGTYTVDTTGQMTFVPLPTYTGTPAPLPYTVLDSTGQKAASTYTPTVIPPPTAVPDTTLGLPNTPQTINVVTNSVGTSDSAAPQTTIAAGSLRLCSPSDTAPNCSVDNTGSVVIPNQGTYTVNPATNAITFTPLASFVGTATPVTYSISDALGQKASTTYTPMVPPPPTAQPDTSINEQGATQWISPLGNDLPGAGAADLNVASVFLCPQGSPPPNCTATTVTVPGEGVYTVTAYGIVKFVPEPQFIGSATTINYQVADNLGQIATSQITVIVLPPPAPSANMDTGSAAYNTSVTLQPWINDAPGKKPADSTLPAPTLVNNSIRLCTTATNPPNCTATSVTTDDGTYVVNTTTGEVVFTPVNGFIGTVTSPVTYQITNNWTGTGGSKTVTSILVPTIGPPGAPAAEVDVTKTKPGTSVVLNPVSNDTPGGAPLNPLTIRLCDANEISPTCTKLDVTTLDGRYVVDPTTGEVTFTPRDGFLGKATVPYVIFDTRGMKANSNLIITVEDNAVVAVPVAKKTKVGLAKTGGARPDLLLLLGLVAIAGAGGLRVLSRKK